MKILIDTHIDIWAVSDDPKLPKVAKDILMDEHNEIFIVRHQYGKLLLSI